MRPLDPAVARHLRPAARPLAGVVAATVVGGVATIAQAFALGTLIVQVTTGRSWVGAAWMLAGVVVVRALTARLADEAAARAAARTAISTRRQVVEAAARLPVREAGSRRVGSLSLLATRGATALEPYVARYLPALAVALVLPVLTLAVIAWLDPLSGLVVALTLPLVPVFAALVGLATRDRAARQWRRLGDLSGHFLDVVRGLPTLVVHRRADVQAARIRATTERYRVATLDTLRLAFASSVVLELVATLSVALVAVTVGLRLAAGGLDFRTALVVLLLAPEAYWPLRRVGAEFHAAAEGTAALSDLDALLALAPAGVRSPDRADPDHPAGRAPVLTVRGPIRGHGEGTLLTGFDATFSAGLTAVVGPSGCGKTTLLDLLGGELPDGADAVTVDGVPLAALDLPTWRRRVATAAQRPWLTPGTIAENVRVGRPGAGDDEVWAALEDVDLGHLVAGLPAGLDTVLGDDGAGLSAGQQARLALARVVLARRPVVLLDEPTAHLDDATEAVLLAVVQRLARTATVVVVAHHEAVVAAADQVVEVPAVPVATPCTDPEAGPAARHPAPAPPAARAEPALADGAPLLSERPRFGEWTALALGSLATASGVALTATAAWLITSAAAGPPVLHLMVAIVAVRTFGLARPVLRYAERLVSHDAALRLLAEQRATVYDRLVPLVPGALGGPRRGEVLTSVVDDVEAVVDQRLRVRQPALTALLVTLGAAAGATLVLPAAGVVVAALGLATAACAALVRLMVGRAERSYVAARARLGAHVEATLHGLRPLVRWGRLDDATRRLDALGLEAARAATRAAGVTATGRAVVLLACGLAPVGVVALVAGSAAGLPGADAAVGAPVLALLVLLPVALADALLPAVDAAALSVRTRASLGRLAALDELTPAVLGPDLPVTLPTGARMEVTGVSAGWGERPAITGLDLVVGPGDRVGVVGPSGCGKSTLAALLVRFLDPVAGDVATGSPTSVALPDLALDDVRRRVGLVDDDPYLFASTVAENVRFARPGADDDTVGAAVRAAGLGAWLESLPHGLATRLGEGYTGVSGGERARLGLARAVLEDPEVLVLDEPTAHLDRATAEAVTADLLAARAGAPGRSLVWITHGTVGLAAMDRVVDLGRLGTPVPVRPLRPR